MTAIGTSMPWKEALQALPVLAQTVRMFLYRFEAE